MLQNYSLQGSHLSWKVLDFLLKISEWKQDEWHYGISSWSKN